MNVSWVLSENIASDAISLDTLTEIGPSWSPWTAWQEYKTDNTVCDDHVTAARLVKRGFQIVSNLYLPQESFIKLNRPSNVRLYSGEFSDSAVSNKDDIIALNLAAPTVDIILMLGFDLANCRYNDPLAEMLCEGYHTNIKSIIEENSEVQFVLVNYENTLADCFNDLQNLTQDTLKAVISLLK